MRTTQANGWGRHRVRLGAGLGLCLVLGWAGCVDSHRHPQPAQPGSATASPGRTDRNPVIVIPGYLGTKLVEEGTGRVVWGAFGGTYANPHEPDGVRLLALPLRDADNPPRVVPAGVLESISASVLGLPIHARTYFRILDILTGAGYLSEDRAADRAAGAAEGPFTCFQFGYDWRLDNAENARRLHEFVLAKRAYVQEQIRKRGGIANADVRFDLVAHSMGALLARYYLLYGPQSLPDDGSLPHLSWEGARYIERAILVAPPNAGTLKSLYSLVDGARFGLSRKYPAAIYGTYPSTYQLLARSRHGAFADANHPAHAIEDILDPGLWERMRWGLLDPRQDRYLRWLLPDVPDAGERRRIALESLRKSLRRARQFQEALDRPAATPRGTSLILMSGDSRATDSVVGIDSDTGRVKTIASAPGDGTVLRSSALMDERIGGKWQPRLVSPIDWDEVIFLSASHLGITKDATFADNMLYRLLEDPRTPAPAE